MHQDLPVISILGVPVARVDAQGALAELERLMREGPGSGSGVVAYVNAHTLELSARDAQLREVLGQAALVLNDGVGVSMAAKLGSGERFLDNLNGTDFTPKILQLAARLGWPVFFMGSAPGVAQKAAEVLMSRIDGLSVVGTHSGFFDGAQEQVMLEQMRASGAKLLVVGMGNPRQEKWLAANLRHSGASIGVGVGAFLDFSAGVFPRAPGWVQALRLEWLYRMCREPRRLWKRYLLGGPVFLGRVLWRRWFGGKA